MLIKNKTVFVYDIECFPNLFTVAIKNTESGVAKCFELSSRKNDILEICKIFQNKKIIFCGYNVIHYDAVLIHYILTNINDLVNQHVLDTCYILKKVSDELIEIKDWKFSSYSKYKYMNLFESLDLLTMMFSNKLRVGLKELQVTMQYPNVQEYDGDFNSYVPENEIDNAILYNLNDINSTEELLNRLKKDIDLRLSIEEEYGINALNKDGVNLGMEILKHRYLEETGLSWKDIRDLRSPCNKVCLNDIIFPFIEFKTKVLQDLLVDLKEQCIDPNDNSFERKFIIGGVAHTYSLGGIHSINKPEMFEPKENQLLIDVDVALIYWRN